MQFWETLHYLPADLLTKMDRASMWSSLEARAPLLDHRIVEFSWRLDPELKASSIVLKRVLRELLAEFVPLELFDRPKQGFSVPLRRWLMRELRAPARDILDSLKSKSPAWLPAKAIDQAWRGLEAGDSTQAQRLWSLIILELWLQRWNLHP